MTKQVSKRGKRWGASPSLGVNSFELEPDSWFLQQEGIDSYVEFLEDAPHLPGGAPKCQPCSTNKVYKPPKSSKKKSIKKKKSKKKTKKKYIKKSPKYSTKKSLKKKSFKKGSRKKTLRKKSKRKSKK